MFITEDLAAGVPLLDVLDAAGHTDPRATDATTTAATTSTGILRTFWLAIFAEGTGLIA